MRGREAIARLQLSAVRTFDRLLLTANVVLWPVACTNYTCNMQIDTLRRARDAQCSCVRRAQRGATLLCVTRGTHVIHSDTKQVCWGSASSEGGYCMDVSPRRAASRCVCACACV
jgi:hypothetical protein